MVAGSTIVKIVIVVAVLLFAAPVAAGAEQVGKVPRIGFLMSTSPSTIADRVEAFRQSLRELGYVEGRNIVVEYRWAEGKIERLPALADELVRLKPHVIVTAGPTVTRAAKQASSTIPIVMAFDSDPVGSGFAASLARPGGNITGLSTLAPEISAKQLELLKEIVPRLSRVAVLGTSTQPGTPQAVRSVEVAAAAFAVQLQYLDVEGPKDIEVAFREAAKGRADAVLALSSRVLLSHRKQIADLAVKSRLPAIYAQRAHVDDGGLMSYGASLADLYWRAAVYVDKILKGAKPGDLPIEQPTKFELVVNMKTAKALGMTIPPSLMLRADKVIE
jgi:putative ABC transport system substrate-binding protein